MGFTRGRSSPCCFRHASKDLSVVVHGDDFTFVGPDAELDWAQEEMSKRFLIKAMGRLGGDQGDVQELRILNRVVRWEESGISYEADPRHSELIVRGTGAGTRRVTTPMVKIQTSRSRFAEGPIEEEEGEGARGEEGEELSPEDAALYRSLAARGIYLGLDRADISYTAKELCRRFQSPTCADMAKLRRLGQYLADAPRLQYWLPWQDAAELRVYTDTDFAGCSHTRKSTSGGCALVGMHLVMRWAATQKAAKLS